MKNDNPYLKAEALESRGEFSLAAEEYNRAIELRIGDQADAHQRRGRALARIGHYDEAVEECKKAISINPDLHLAHGVLGQAYFHQGDYDLAEQELLHALRMKEDDAIAMTTLTHIYLEQDRKKEAMQMLKGTLQYQPRNLRLWVILADLYRDKFCLGKVFKELQDTPELGVFFQTQFYVAVFVTAVLKFFERLSPPARMSIGLGIYGIALLAPSILSVPVGFLLLVFGLLLIFMYPRVYVYEGKELRILFLFLLYFLDCAVYWGIVFLMRPLLIG